MNKERAIKILRMNSQEIWRAGITVEEEEEALNMAIEALNGQLHGKWICGEGLDFRVKCSYCGNLEILKARNFCPNCGALMIERGLCVKAGLIDEAADVEPDFKYIKVGDTIYTQDSDKQGWTGREEK